MYDFEFHKPSTVAEAVRMLGADESKALAGGQTFIPVLKQRLNRPSTIIDLHSLGLDKITADAGTITIGAMATHQAILSDPAIRQHIPGLAKMAALIGDIQVRHRGTMGGSLANNDPASCYPAAALALGATVVTDQRRIPIDAYFQGMFTTALAQDEIITSIEFPVPEKSNYEKFRNPASRYAMVGVFVARGPAGVRVAITGAAQDGVFRHSAMEQALSQSWSADAIAGIVTPADGLNSDIHAGAEYRAHLIGVMARRAVAGC